MENNDGERKSPEKRHSAKKMFNQKESIFIFTSCLFGKKAQLFGILKK